MAVRQDLTFVKGTTWKIDLTAHDGDGDIIDLTNATIKLRISTLANVAVDTRQTGGSGIALVTATLGTYTYILTPSNQTTSGIAASTNYKYEVQITDTNSVVYDQLYGIIEVEPSLF